MGKRKHNGAITAEEFTKLTLAELYNMVQQSGEHLFCLSLNGADDKPFCMFALAIAEPKRLEEYAKALYAAQPTILEAAIAKGLDG
jgi:hypothetical protein